MLTCQTGFVQHLQQSHQVGGNRQKYNFFFVLALRLLYGGNKVLQPPTTPPSLPASISQCFLSISESSLHLFKNALLKLVRHLYTNRQVLSSFCSKSQQTIQAALAKRVKRSVTWCDNPALFFLDLFPKSWGLLSNNLKAVWISSSAEMATGLKQKQRENKETKSKKKKWKSETRASENYVNSSPQNQVQIFFFLRVGLSIIQIVLVCRIGFILLNIIELH